MKWEIDQRRALMERGTNSHNIQIFKSLSRSPPLSTLAPQISVTKWTYNWKSGRTKILLTFSLSCLDISSAELQGWYEHMGRRWGKENNIRRGHSLVFARDFLILSFFFLLLFIHLFFVWGRGGFTHKHTLKELHTHSLAHLFLSSNNVSHYSLSPRVCHIGRSPMMIS